MNAEEYKMSLEESSFNWINQLNACVEKCKSKNMSTSKIIAHVTKKENYIIADVETFKRCYNLL